jgi:hypothetical protein
MGADLSYGIYSSLCRTFTEKPITGNNLTSHRYWSDLLCLWKDEFVFGDFFCSINNLMIIRATDGAILKSHIVAKCGFTTHVSFFNEVTQ